MSGQPYMWRLHVVYESLPCSIIVTLGGQRYKIPEVVLTIVLTKQCCKVISHTAKFILFIIWLEEDTATPTASIQDPSIHQKQINKIVEEHQDIPTTPTRCLHMINSFIFFMLHLHRHSPPTLRQIMQPDWLNRSNPSNNRFITTFHKLSKTTSSARQATRQGSDSTKASPRTSHNGDHCFLRGQGLIQSEIGGHLPIPLAQNRGFHLGSFSTYFWVLNFWGCFEALNNVLWAHHCHNVG
jgi:hypothetical protein